MQRLDSTHLCCGFSHFLHHMVFCIINWSVRRNLTPPLFRQALWLFDNFFLYGLRGNFSSDSAPRLVAQLEPSLQGLDGHSAGLKAAHRLAARQVGPGSRFLLLIIPRDQSIQNLMALCRRWSCLTGVKKKVAGLISLAKMSEKELKNVV